MPFKSEDTALSDPQVAAVRAGEYADPLSAVLASLDESKAEDIVSIDIKGKTAMADHMVIASGRSNRHVGAIADHLVRHLKNAGFGAPRVEGLPHCDWVLIDAGDIIVHLFRPDVRTFYNIEKMWSAEAETTPQYSN
nr:ribosome silencing factor [Breoghania corrubedonensis]